MSEIIQIIEKEKKELQEMKKIRAETGLSLGKLINLKEKGYKIIKICGEKCKCH